MTKNTKGITIIVGCIIFLILVSSIRWYILDRREYDKDTLCPVKRPIAAHTVLLVDKTDPLSEVQKEGLHLVIKGIKKRLKQYELFSIYLITADTVNNPPLVFSLCNPGNDPNPIYENIRNVKKRYDEQFGRPLDAILRELMKGTTSPQSPILEVITNIAGAPSFSNRLERNLVIFSDLLQNVSTYSHYGKLADYKEFLKLSYASTVKTDLSAVTITVHYIERPRDAQHQGKKHIYFWREYFQDSGSSHVDFLYVSASPLRL